MLSQTWRAPETTIKMEEKSQSAARSSAAEVPLSETRRSKEKQEKTNEEERDMGVQEKEDAAPPTGKKQKTSKEVYFSILPDKYEPLIEEFEEEREETPEERRRRKEEKKRKKKQQYKKYRKNVWKALRFSCRCLVAGLQSMVSAYATPLSAMSTVVSDVQRSGDSRA